MSNRSILIVEDEAIVAADLANKVRKLGYNVIGTTATGEEAIELARQQRPALVLMDIRLAGVMDGIAAAEQIHRECKLPVLFLTANSDTGSIKQAQQAGALGYILKPFDERDLRIQIEMALYKHATEQRLRENEEQFRIMFEQSGVGKAQVDLTTGRFLRVNAALCRLLDSSEEEMLQRTFFEVTHPEDREAELVQFGALVEGAIESYQLEKRYLRPDATVKWVHVTVNLVRDAAGRPVRTMAVIQDITGRKQAEEELRQSEERYRSLFNLMLEGFCIIEVLFDADDRPVDYRFLEINPAFEAQTGLHNVQGKLIRELAPDNEAYWYEMYGNVALTGKSTRFVNEAKALNRWFDVSAYRIGGPDSRRVAILFNDITESKRAELALEKLNEELERRILERTQELAITIEQLQLEITDRLKAEESVQRLNQLYAVLSETSHAIIRTKDRETLFHDFCRIATEKGSFKLAWIGLVDEVSRELKVVASAGATGYLEDLRITIKEEPEGLGPTGISVRDGSYYICNDFLGSPITRPWHERGRAYGLCASASIALKQEERVVGALTLYVDQKDFFDQQQVELLRQMGADISFALDLIVREARRQEAEQHLRRETADRLRAEGKIRALNAELEQRVIERTVQLEAANRELEAFSYSVSHDLRAPLRAIDGFSQALLDRYHDRLDEKGGDYLRRVRNATQKMAQLIDDLLKLSRLTRGAMNLTAVDLSRLAGDVAAELRKSQEGRRVSFLITEGIVAQCDQHLLKVVLNNLLGNAWKFTGNKQEATIEFGSKLIEGLQTYFVHDNGAGFDMAYSDKLFATFQRLHLEREFPGTGIGLSLVQRIIHRHGGKIWAEGKVDKGATFYFTLNPMQGTEHE